MLSFIIIFIIIIIIIIIVIKIMMMIIRKTIVIIIWNLQIIRHSSLFGYALSVLLPFVFCCRRSTSTFKLPYYVHNRLYDRLVRKYLILPFN